MPDPGAGAMPPRRPAGRLAGPSRGPLLAHLAALAALYAAALAPLLTVQVPLLRDYPNHLARLHILAHADDPGLAGFYRVDWQALPNLAFDAIGLPLALAFGPVVAGQIFLGLIFAVTLVGVVALNLAINGRPTPGAYVAAFFVYNQALWTGLVGYLFAVGLSLGLIAAWIRLAGRGAAVRALVGAAFAVVLFFAHLYALGIFVIFTFAAELAWLKDRLAAGGPGGRARLVAGRLAPWSVQLLVPLVLLAAASPTGSAFRLDTLVADVLADIVGTGWPLSELHRALWVFMGVAPWIGLPVVLFFLVAMAALALEIRRERRGTTLYWSVLLFAGLTFLVFLVLPRRLLTSFHADWRLIVPLALIAAAALPRPRLARVGAALVAVAVAATLAKGWMVGERVRQGPPALAHWQAVEAAIPEGARVFRFTLCSVEPVITFPALDHVPALTVMDKPILLASLFADPSQQPVTMPALPDDLRIIQARLPAWIPLERYASAFDRAVQIERLAPDDPPCPPPEGWRVLVEDGPFRVLAPPRPDPG